jgi:hypothetical protein
METSLALEIPIFGRGSVKMKKHCCSGRKTDKNAYLQFKIN